MKTLIVLCAMMWASVAWAEPLLYVSPENSVRVVLPDSLQDDVEAVLDWVDLRAEEFRVQCYKWQDHERCERAIVSPLVKIVDDFTVFCGRGVSPSSLCGGVSNLRGRITVLMYGKINAATLDECAGSPIIRDREGMYELSRGNVYWLNHASNYFCANMQEILPALVHEMCHFFGRRIGHVAGFEECQSIR